MAEPKRRSITYMPLDEIKSATRNPKDHAPDEIAASMTRFGFIEPMVLDERTGMLVSGHGRRDELLRARDAGEAPPDGVVVTRGTWSAPVTRGWASHNDAEALAAGIALNRLVERGGWHEAELWPVLADLAATDQGLDGLGFDLSHLADLEMVLGPPPTLDQLEREHGTLTGRELWPVVRATVSPRTKALWDKLCASVDSTDEDVVIATIVQRAT